LEANPERFNVQIEYCLQLKNLSSGRTSEEFVTNIAEKKLSPDNRIELFPSSVANESKYSKLRLAAKSISPEKKKYSYSFTDNNSEHIIKIINTGAETLLYFISLVPLTNTKVTFIPSGNSYLIIDSLKPIEILTEEKIEKIIISKE